MTGEKPGTGPDTGVVTPTARGLFGASAALAVISLGLPWGASSETAQFTIGANHPVRVLALVAAALMLGAVRQDSPGLARLAILVAGCALPLDLANGLGSGRAVFAAAVVLAAIASGVLPRPRRSGNREPCENRIGGPG
jgi:hypothetical protein